MAGGVRRWWWLGALAIVLVGAGLGSALVTGHGAPARPAKERLLGATDGRSVVRFSLVLRLQQRRLNRFMAGLYDPSSRFYHRFIDARTFGRRFGISDRQLARVLRSLDRYRVQITGQYPQRTSIDLAAPAAVIDHMFGIRLMDFRAQDGRLFHVPLGATVIPRAISGPVVGVAGLNGRFLPKPEDVPAGGLTPATVARAYDIAPLHNQGISGQGEKVAIIAFSRYDPADLSGFSSQFGLPPINIRSIPASRDGGATDTSQEGVGEANLDAEVVHEVAPQAQILDYSAPITSSSGGDTLGEVIDKIVADGQATVATDSYGFCEPSFPPDDLRRGEQAIESAVSRGISIFKSSGDAGAYQCQRSDSSDRDLTVEWPASSPGVVAVGGTALSVTPSSNYDHETAWEGTLSRSGGGGGLSAVFARPGWQKAPGVNNQFANGKRQVPDVSADSDLFTGWATYNGGQRDLSGGTSAASPFWAASMALIEQYARQHGINKLGFVDPMLYQIASTPQKAQPFHDVTIGYNRYYPATVGWDFATGLGSPDVYNLAQDVVEYLNNHPAS